MSRLRAPIALTVFTVGVFTILIAFMVVKTRGIYVGGLAWPFISDLGRDPPSSYVFFFGLSAAGVLLGLAWTFNHEYEHRFLQKSVENGQISPFVCSLSFVSCLFGIAGAIGLPLFASFDTSPTIHESAAVAFLVTEAIAMYVDAFLTFKIFQAKREELDIGVFITDRDGPRSVARIKFEELRCVKRGFLLQLACISVFTVAMLVYLPLLYQAPPSVHLTIAECLANKLGEDYCKQRVRLNDTDTKLWNYENDLAVNQVRALAQLVCILVMLVYTLSFVVNNAEEEAMNERDRFAVMAKYYASKSSSDGGGSFGASPRGSTVSTASTNRGRRTSRSSSPSKRSTRSSPGRTSATVFV